MLTIIVVAALIWVTVHLLIVGVKAAWGIAKVLCAILLLPAFIIALTFIGLFYIAIPLLAIIGLICLLGKRAVV